MNNHTFVFVGGLHRSGTTLLAHALADHPLVSGFSGTGAPEDEGQHLQTVYPPALSHGGPGAFGFAPQAHLTERSPLVAEGNRKMLFDQWSRYWDLSKPVLLEKSPPNLMRMRFLQAIFPGAYFVVVVRHPVAVTLATQRWRKGRKGMPHTLIRHWLRCHETMLEDLADLQHFLLVRYEDMVANPDRELARVQTFLGLMPAPSGREFKAGLDERYFARWQELRRRPLTGLYLEGVGRWYERRAQRLGYSLRGALPPINDDRSAIDRHAWAA